MGEPNTAPEPTQENLMDIDELQAPDPGQFDFSDLGPDDQTFNEEGVMLPFPSTPATPDPTPELAKPEPEPEPDIGPPPKWQQYGFKSLEEYNHAVELQNAELQGRLAGSQTQPTQRQPSVDEVIAQQEAALIGRLKKSHGMPEGGEGFVQEILRHSRGESDYKLALLEKKYEQELNALREPMSQVFDRLSIMQEAPPEVQKAQDEAIYMQNALVAAGIPKNEARATVSTLFKNILQKNATIAAATGATPNPTPTAPTPPPPNLKVVASKPKMPSADEAPPANKGQDAKAEIKQFEEWFDSRLGKKGR